MADLDSIASAEHVTDDGERWRPVAGFEGRYIVSDRGKVRSVAHIDRYGRTKHARTRALRVGTTGYYEVGLYASTVVTG